MPRRILLTVAATLAFASRTVADEPRPISQADNIFAIYANDSGLGSGPYRGAQMIFCAWEDGHVVWSTNRIKGGPPYRTAQVTPEDVAALLKRIDGYGAFDIPRLNGGKVIVDSSFTTILVRWNGKQLKMQSSHELYEASGSTILLEGIVPGREPRKLLELLAEETAEDLQYRVAWLELRLAATSLIPAAGSEATGSPQMRFGVLSWQPKGNYHPR